MNLSTEPLATDTTAPETGAPPRPPSASSTVRKFMFERSFDDATIVHRAAERKPVLMKPEQIDAMKKESYDSGFEAGKIAGKEEQTAQLNATLVTVEQNIARLIENLGGLAQEQEINTRRLVLAIAKKLLPDFTARNGLQEIDALLNDTIREMAREPRLVVRVSESQFDTINERIQVIATQRAYSGKVIVLADAEVAAGDCRVEWADGGVERNVAATLDMIQQTILPTT